MSTQEAHKKIRVAIDTSFMDRRPGMGTAVFIRKTVEYLRAYRDELDITLVHRESILEDPLYQEFNEIIVPQLPVPKGRKLLSELLFFITTTKRFDVYYFAYAHLPWYFFLAPGKKIISIQYDGGPSTVGVSFGKAKNRISWLLRLFIGRVSVFIATSFFGKRGLVEAQHLPEEKILVLYGGVDPMFTVGSKEEAQRYIQEKYHLPQGPYIIGSGRLDPHKNIHRLVEAFEILKNKHHIPHTLLVLGGTHTPGYSEEVLQSIKDKGLEETCHILKVSDFSDMPRFYQAGDLMVFPSLYEGFGLPAAEAMRCGIPTVLSNIASLTEVGGEATEFINPTDAGDIARGIKRVLDEPEHARTLIERGLAHSAVFTWESHVKKLVETVRDLVRSV